MERECLDRLPMTNLSELILLFRARRKPLLSPLKPLMTLNVTCVPVINARPGNTILIIRVFM